VTVSPSRYPNGHAIALFSHPSGQGIFLSACRLRDQSYVVGSRQYAGRSAQAMGSHDTHATLFPDRGEEMRAKYRKAQSYPIVERSS